MNQKEIKVASMVSAKAPSGVIGMPLIGEAFNFNVMKEIKLSQFGRNKNKFVALVDDEDYDYLNQFKWNAQKQRSGNYYASRSIYLGKMKRKSLRMHRLIMKPERGMTVDHIDHNGLNNQKSNLRNCSFADNVRNRSCRSKTGYIGVYIYKSKRSKTIKYLAKIEYNNRAYYLGLYKTAKEAAIVRDSAAKKYFGKFANLNFKN